MHEDEPDHDEDLVARLVAAQFPRWAGLPVRPVPSSGTDNAMYRLGEALAVRLPRRPGAAADIAVEAHWPAVLAPHLPVTVPVPLEVGEPAAGYPWPWSVHRWLPGRNPVPGRLVEPVRLARELAGFVNALRAVPPAAGAPRAGRGVPLAARDAPTREALAQLARLGPAAEPVDVPALTEVWEAALALPAAAGEDRWLHGDLAPGNVLVTDDGQLSAVIDFGGLGVGDPTVEQQVAWNLLPAEARGAFRDALGVDDAGWRRGRAWALSVALIQLPYYRHTNPVLAANSRLVIAEVLADHARHG
ncbi:aminoglycoside phosphotransferase family protein [Streptomyces sp. DSM 44915]|uniref:Aminoglycoside phosphotransferase family protein n=1 Tax=Streptomyces chisholmiae TaxID=3075540 RepID=A0ABU2JJ17_9ACTN|nr:aminoglycoside phosphotransferase family protein [Streptomyces sp. DSM 44915]MDT0264756.1 aminoglycoside phosphotransferase family protein [Streptomyces sp. DSM 44915]